MLVILAVSVVKLREDVKEMQFALMNLMHGHELMRVFDQSKMKITIQEHLDLRIYL
jgi:hypothetical protein